MKKIFGQIYVHDTASPHLGRSVAEQQFNEALLLYGTFDEYHVFYENEKHAQGLKHDRVKLFHITQLQDKLATTPYVVFHTSDPLIDKLLQIRGTSKLLEPYAVTGYTHSLNPSFLLPGYFLTLLYQPGPHDGIICSSICGQQVMQKIFGNLQAKFKSAYGHDLPFRAQLPHIPLGINLSEFNKTSRAEARKLLQLGENKKIMLSIARLTPASKMDYFPMIDILAQVVTAEPEAVLILAGGLSEDKRTYLDELHQYIKEKNLAHNVIMCPNFDKKDKHLLYSAADLFVSPSDNIQETFGLTIIEAQASGLPVICSDWSGYKELVDEGITGHKIKTISQRQNKHVETLSLYSYSTAFVMAQHTIIDQKDYVRKINSLFRNKDKLKAMSEAAREKAKKYDWAMLVPIYEQTWLELKKQALTGYKKSEFFLDFSYHHVFSHFPTHLLSDNHQLAITTAGQDLLSNKKQISINMLIQPYINMNLLAEILKNVAVQKTSVGRIKQRSGELAESHILWLAKYGALEIITGD